MNSFDITRYEAVNKVYRLKDAINFQDSDFYADWLPIKQPVFSDIEMTALVDFAKVAGRLELNVLKFCSMRPLS